MSTDHHTVPGTTAAADAARDTLRPPEAIEAVRAAVASWDGVTTHAHRFAGMAFRVGRRELGHLHGTIADLPVPRRVRDALVAAGRARPHQVIPESGWITVPMRTASEVAHVIQLFRWNYARDWAALGEPRETSSPVGDR